MNIFQFFFIYLQGQPKAYVILNTGLVIKNHQMNHQIRRTFDSV